MVKLLNKIFDIVQKEIPSSFETFIIEKSEMKQIFKNVKDCILSCKGQQSETDFILDSKNNSKQEISPIKSCTKIMDNWFKKYKAKIYGNCCLYPIIFIHILNVCWLICYL